MLTESQFKVLMMLLDDKGHAGWELAEALGMEESNLNPPLKRLEDIGFIFQGMPRKSNRPKKPKGYTKSKNVGKVTTIPKREGDYKEIPYYIKKDLNVLASMIKEMVITNRRYDTGFPYRIIRASNYMRSMGSTFHETFHEFMGNLLNEVHMQYVNADCCLNDQPKYRKELSSEILLKELHYEVFLDEIPPSYEIPFLENNAEELLDRIESWWFRYNMRSCLSRDTAIIIDHDEFLAALKDYGVYRGNIDTAIIRALKRLGDHSLDIGQVDV